MPISQPMVYVNGTCITNGITHRLNWRATEGLLEPAGLEMGSTFDTFAGKGKVRAQAVSYQPRRIVIVGRLINRSGFLDKYAALASLESTFSGNPSTVRVGTLELSAEFGPVTIVEDNYRLTGGVLTYRVEGEAIPATYAGSYGYALGIDQGLAVRDDRPDHISLKFASNTFTFTNPGTAPCEAVVSLTGTASTTYYLKGTDARRVAMTTDAAGNASIDQASGFVLYPGAQTIRVEDSSGNLATGVTAVNFYGTTFRFLANASNGATTASATTNRMSEGPMLTAARTGSATYIGTAGTLTTATDGQARLGVPSGTYSATKAGLILEGSFTNSLANPDAPATQTVSLTAGTYTAYMDGTGNVVLSGGPTGTVTQAAPVTFTLGATTSVTFTVSGTVTRFGCVNLPFRPSHISGTKQPDLCGIVSPQNLLKYSQQIENVAFWSANGNVTATGNTADTTAPDNTQTATKLVCTTANHAWRTDFISATAGSTYTASVWYKATAGVQPVILITAYDAAGTNLGNNSKTLTASGGWDRIPVTYTLPANATRVRISLQLPVATVHAWGAQLVEGSHPGIYVRTTDTAIAKPVDAILDPAWVQNGSLKVRILPPAISTGLLYSLVGALGNEVFRLFRSSGSGTSDQSAFFDRGHNGATGTSGVAGRGRLTSTATIYDSAPHDVELIWRNYTVNGVRSMPMEIWVDGVLVATQDVAALYGATAWTAPNASVLLSDGSTFATLRAPSDGGPIIRYPTLPQGAIPAA